MLSVARSLGDYDPDTGAKVLGVSGEAEVTELVLDDAHEFLIVRTTLPPALADACAAATTPPPHLMLTSEPVDAVFGCNGWLGSL